jgi:hypothetical protein
MLLELGGTPAAPVAASPIGGSPRTAPNARSTCLRQLGQKNVQLRGMFLPGFFAPVKVSDSLA